MIHHIIINHQMDRGFTWFLLHDINHMKGSRLVNQ